MLFWFLATSVFAVYYVFRDPAFDYRLLMVGSLIPLASVRVLHSVLFGVVLLGVLMVVFRRGARRRMLLGLPIGVLLHLVFTGAWTDQQVFWWPLFGWGIDGAEHPVLARGWWNVPLEVVGLAGCRLIAKRIDWRTGRIATLP